MKKAEQDGILKPGATIVEAAVEILESVFHGLVLLKDISCYRLARNDECGTMGIKAYGADQSTPGSEGMKRCDCQSEIAAERGGFLPLQFSNPANPEVHEKEQQG